MRLARRDGYFTHSSICSDWDGPATTNEEFSAHPFSPPRGQPDRRPLRSNAPSGLAPEMGHSTGSERDCSPRRILTLSGRKTGHGIFSAAGEVDSERAALKALAIPLDGEFVPRVRFCLPLLLCALYA